MVGNSVDNAIYKVETYAPSGMGQELKVASAWHYGDTRWVRVFMYICVCVFV